MPRAWIALAVALAAGCQVQPESPTPAADSAAIARAMPVTQPVGPDTTPKALRDWLEAERYRERWTLWPDSLPIRPAAEPHHGALLTGYANPIAIDALERGLIPLPDGSILLVEDRAADTTLTSVSVMVRKGDPRAEGGGWGFVRLGSAGEIDPGSGTACAACHVLDPDRVFGADVGTPWPIDSTGAFPIPDSL
ncbi:MAG TPA: cytochrome P460 family protein [Gemmatimonadota bacterium]|nr:cytochrome P460 family protein [Gemmatimonadota bacterium]